MRVETLIFDIGNVVVRFDWQPVYGRLRGSCAKLTTNAEKDFRKLIARLEVGEMTGERFARLATQTIGFQGDEREFIAIWNSIFSSNPPMERTILGLKERFPLFLLSNTSDLHLAYLKRNYGVLQYFVDGVYSFRAKCAKPGRRIFEIAIQQLCVEPQNTTYIDDLAANVRSASDLGFNAIQYDLTKHVEFERRLAKLGVQI
jgi:FMN phosphatase YigB (HAD superfamily)